jgi:hypothetical protein
MVLIHSASHGSVPPLLILALLVFIIACVNSVHFTGTYTLRVFVVLRLSGEGVISFYSIESAGAAPRLVGFSRRFRKDCPVDTDTRERE